jgi:hypothetical protein
MKKITFFVLLLTIATASYSQEIAAPIAGLTKQDYLQKSKHQKTAAWILVGSGTVLGTIGTIKILKEAVKIPLVLLPGEPVPDNAKANWGGAITVIGGAAIICSVPLFVAAGKNKTKGAVISFKNTPTQTLLKNSFVYNYIPSVSVTFRL